MTRSPRSRSLASHSTRVGAEPTAAVRKSAEPAAGAMTWPSSAKSQKPRTQASAGTAGSDRTRPGRFIVSTCPDMQRGRNRPASSVGPSTDGSGRPASARVTWTASWMPKSVSKTSRILAPPERPAISHSTRRSSGVWKTSAWKACVRSREPAGFRAARVASTSASSRGVSGSSRSSVRSTRGPGSAPKEASSYWYWEGQAATVLPSTTRPSTWHIRPGTYASTSRSSREPSP